MLGPIVEAIVNCRDVAATAEFNQAAYGLDILADADGTVLMGAPGSSTGRVRLVPAATNSTDRPRLWDAGPRLLGIYSRDLRETCSRVAAAGGDTLPIASYGYGSSTMREVVTIGPDDLYWTIPEVDGAPRQPSPALTDPARLHGELHSAVLVPTDHDATLDFFLAAGLKTVFDGSFSGEPFVSMTGMPADATLRLSFLSAADGQPARLEIMSFHGVQSRDMTAHPVGLRRLLFACDDVVATSELLVAGGAQPERPGVVRGPDGIEISLRPASEVGL